MSEMKKGPKRLLWGAGLAAYVGGVFLGVSMDGGRPVQAAGDVVPVEVAQSKSPLEVRVGEPLLALVTQLIDNPDGRTTVLDNLAQPGCNQDPSCMDYSVLRANPDGSQSEFSIRTNERQKIKFSSDANEYGEMTVWQEWHVTATTYDPNSGAVTRRVDIENPTVINTDTGATTRRVSVTVIADGQTSFTTHDGTGGEGLSNPQVDMINRAAAVVGSFEADAQVTSLEAIPS